MKRFLSITCMAVLTMTMLFGCGSKEKETVRVGSLKGPTTMGLVNMMKDSENGKTEGKYEFSMKTQPDEIMAGMVSGDIDIALVPANMASVLYNKTEGGVKVIDINTLGVLYCVTGDDSVSSVSDFSGKTWMLFLPLSVIMAVVEDILFK